MQLIPIFLPSEASVRIGLSLFSPIAACNSLLIGFLLNQAQTNYREVQVLVAQEAAKINNLDRLLVRYDSDCAHELRIDLMRYINSIIDSEWKSLQGGRGSPETHMLWRSISQRLMKLDSDTPRQATMYGDILKISAEVAECREKRIERATVRLPNLCWLVILIGLVSIIFINSLFYQTSDTAFSLKIIPLFLGALVSLLFITDEPFKGDQAIKADAIAAIRNSIQTRTE